MEQKLNEISMRNITRTKPTDQKLDEIPEMIIPSKSDNESDAYFKQISSTKQHFDRQTQSIKGMISTNEQSTKLMIDKMNEKLASLEHVTTEIMGKIDNDLSAKRILELEQVLNTERAENREKMNAMEWKINSMTNQIKILMESRNTNDVEMIKSRAIQTRVDNVEKVMDQIANQNASLSALVHSVSSSVEGMTMKQSLKSLNPMNHANQSSSARSSAKQKRKSTKESKSVLNTLSVCTGKIHPNVDSVYRNVNESLRPKDSRKIHKIQPVTYSKTGTKVKPSDNTQEIYHGMKQLALKERRIRKKLDDHMHRRVVGTDGLTDSKHFWV